MSSRNADREGPGPAGPPSLDRADGPPWPRFASVIVLSAWCGLIAGLAEVGLTVLRKQVLGPNHFYWTSRYFVGLVPLTDLVIFLAFGAVLALPAWRGRRGRWLAPRLLCALTFLPPIWAASPRIFGPAGLLLALGGASWAVPALQRRRAGFRRLVRLSFPIVAGLAAALAAAPRVVDAVSARAESARPLPSSESPNLLLIVMDTVAAGHLHLHGYDRATSTSLEELARSGVRFERAQATASWTLPSHASMFTGQWPHDLSTGWLTPLDGRFPTLAEFLRDRGYATAGFIANYWYCAADSGLARGFTVYRDYIFSGLSACKGAVLINRPVDGAQAIETFLESRLGFDGLKAAARRLWWAFNADRKGADAINREFLDWLSRRGGPRRPFFAFLNYYDAHHPYQLPDMSIHRFGTRAEDQRDLDPFAERALLAGKGVSREQTVRDRDAYDDCVAHLDERVGILIDELERRKLLEQTWVIIVSDHGESFGERPGVFRHATALDQTQIHVPLLVLPPRGAAMPPRQTVPETVSLRDLAATVVDVLGFPATHPFPGESLMRFARGPGIARPALAELVPLDVHDPDPARILERRWPIASLTEGDWSYLRREEDGREELFNLRDDPHQTRNLVRDPASRITLDRMKTTLNRLTAGPLRPGRFRP